MADLNAYWRAHDQEKETAVQFARLAMGQVKSGSDYADCARFIVGMGLLTELGDTLLDGVVKRVVEIVNLGDPRPTLQNAAGLGEAARLLTEASKSG
ncbi:MAG TPA: hypothetical protein VHU85_17895 [Acidimicrobiales bacterium]|jgi:hypothetical protein|nr:hypothetical protein [Acidimicrobiales bacterium]